jgi:hypothetical protein
MMPRYIPAMAMGDSDEAIRDLTRGSGLPGGACHRAARRAHPLRRNDAKKGTIDALA